MLLSCNSVCSVKNWQLNEMDGIVNIFIKRLEDAEMTVPKIRETRYICSKAGDRDMQ